VGSAHWGHAATNEFVHEGESETLAHDARLSRIGPARGRETMGNVDIWRYLDPVEFGGWCGFPQQPQGGRMASTRKRSTVQVCVRPPHRTPAPAGVLPFSGPVDNEVWTASTCIRPGSDGGRSALEWRHIHRMHLSSARGLDEAVGIWQDAQFPAR